MVDFAIYAVGIITAIAGALVVLVFSVLFSLYAIHAYRGENNPDQIARFFMRKLEEEAYWFSEDEATFGLIQDLAHGLNVDVARERWRNQRAVDQLKLTKSS